MLAVGILILRERRAGGDPDVRLTHRSATIRLPWLLGIGFAVGLCSGFLGIGGSFLIVPGLLLASGTPLLLAIGAALVALSIFGVATAARRAASPPA